MTVCEQSIDLKNAIAQTPSELLIEASPKPALPVVAVSCRGKENPLKTNLTDTFSCRHRKKGLISFCVLRKKVENPLVLNQSKLTTQCPERFGFRAFVHGKKAADRNSHRSANLEFGLARRPSSDSKPKPNLLILLLLSRSQEKLSLLLLPFQSLRIFM